MSHRRVSRYTVLKNLKTSILLNKQMKSNCLAGRLGVITGGSGTIGQAIATVLFQHGMSVVLVGRRYETLQRTKDIILRSKQEQFISIPSSSDNDENNHAVVEIVSCDISSAQDVQQLFTTIDEKFASQRLDLLVNNAGINIPGTTDELDGDDFRKVLEVNVTGSFLCAQQAFRRMKVPHSTNRHDSGTINTGGRIINIGSIASHAPRPHSVAYTTSKFALNGLTRSLALDGRPFNISVGIIHPGNVMSDILTETEKVQRADEGFLSAQHLADGVLYMASLPLESSVLELTVHPTSQPFYGRG
jgi:NAD(P)-dependent dehydrogenase (short-subunit alcohol dehydrogenase family)